MRPARVQVVCDGNPGRSAMAEVVLRDLLSRSPAAAATEITSAGLLVHQPGAPADPEALTALAAVGLDGSAHRATQFEIDDFPELDLVVFAEERHVGLVASAWPPRGWQERARLIRSFDPVASALRETDLADPYGRGAQAYRQCLKDIRAAAPRVITEIERLAEVS